MLGKKALVQSLFPAFIAASLTGCATTQNHLQSVNNTLSSSFQSVTDVFDKTGNNLRALVKDKKYPEAVELFNKNDEYFQKRKTDDKQRVQGELGPVAGYLYTTNYESRVDSALAALALIVDTKDMAEWQKQRQTLKSAMATSWAINDDKLLTYTENYPGQLQVRALNGEINRVIAVAKRDEEVALTATHSRVFAEGVPAAGVEYVFQDFTKEKYLASSAFQTALYGYMAVVPEAQADAINAKLWPLLSIDNRKRYVAEVYMPRLRSKYLADGKIDLDELQKLIQLKKTRSFIDISQIVRIGSIDLTSETLKNRGLFDFQVEFTQDLPFQVTNAKDVMFKNSSLADFDFLFVTDLTVAKVGRVFKNKKELPSRVKTGTRQQQNPAYVTAMTQYQLALSDMQSASLEAAAKRSQPCYGGGVACALAGLANGLAEGGAKNRVEESSQLLAKTNQYVNVPVYSQYNYQAVDIETAKAAKVDYYIVDVKGRKVYANNFEVTNKEKFTVAYNVQDEDPEKAKIISNNQKEDDVVAWEKRPVTVKLSQLFDIANIKTAKDSPFTTVQAFLQPFTNRAYAAYAPSYISGATAAAASQTTASASTIADERFESVVVVRTSKAIGTGFYVTPDLILTAYHVVDGSSLVELSMHDGGKNFGKVVDHDVRLDLALIRAQSPGKPVKIHTGPIKLGETVEAIGHPKGYEYTITRGVVSAIRKTAGASNIGTHVPVEFVQTDTPISPGNSGGPLFMGTSVIGVNDWIRVDKGSQNLNFSVSFNEVKSYLDRFKSK